MDPIHFSRPITFAFSTLICLTFAFSISAQIRDSFEGEKTQWELVRVADSSIQKTFHQEISTRQQHSGRSSEFFRFESQAPAKALLGLDLEPMSAIKEWKPEVWIKSPHADVQFLARVVLPYSKIPDSDQPVTVLIEGPTFQKNVDWQKIRFRFDKRDIEKRIQEKIWMLRERFRDATIHSRNAYVDMLVVGLYASRGVNEIWLDDLKIDGIVSAGELAKQVERNGALVKNNLVQQTHFQEEKKPRAWFVRKGSVIEYRGQPFATRSIQHNGESFEFLKRLGFNTIELRSPATREQLAEAQRQQLWLISPPPRQIGLYQFDSSFDPVLGWILGDQLGPQDIAKAQQTIREIRESESRSERPVILDVVSNWATYGRLGSALSISHEPIGSSLQLQTFSDWIGRWRKESGNLPMLVGIQTEMPTALIEQVSAITGRVPPTPISPAQMQYKMYEAITGGARGIRFLSHSRLDGNDPSSRLRALTLRWLTQQLIELEPWIAGGAVTDRIQTGIKNLEVTQIKTNRTRLLLVQKSTGWEQWFAGDATVSEQSFIDSQASNGDQVYWLSPQGPLPKSNTATISGLRIDLKGTGICSAFIISQSDHAMKRLSNSYGKLDRNARDEIQTQLTQNWLAIEQLLARQIAEVGGGNIAIQGPIDQAGIHLQQAQQLIRRQSSILAMQYFSQADRELAVARREMVMAGRRGFRSRMASPLVAHASLIPGHWELGRRLSQGKWNPNGLAGGDFENLEHMQKNGWKNHRSDSDQVQTNVELSADAAVAGQFGLRLTCTARQGPVEVVPSPPLWISSGGVNVKAGQMVRIHGWVRIDETITGSADGFLITDSLGSIELSERIYKTNEWQEFTLYRAARENGKVNVRFTLTGIGSVMLDEVTIRTVDLPAPDRSANRDQPLDR